MLVVSLLIAMVHGAQDPGSPWQHGDHCGYSEAAFDDPILVERYEFINRIEEVLDQNDRVIGWIYSGDKGDKAVQGNLRMSATLQSKLGLSLYSQSYSQSATGVTAGHRSRDIWTNFRRITTSQMHQLHVVNCPVASRIRNPSSMRFRIEAERALR